MTRAMPLSLHGFARILLPPLSSLVLVLLSCMPPGVPGLATVAPLWGLMAVHAWALARPELLGIGSATLLGLVYDALSDLPLGLTGLCFLLARWLPVGPLAWLHGQRFASAWLGFLAICAIDFALVWTVRVLQAWELLDPSPMLMQGALTVALYPAIAAGVGLLARRPVRERGA